MAAMPAAVIEHVRDCREKVFNSYGDGGYLIWFVPDVPVFIDSRQDPYSLTFLQDYISLERTAEYGPVFARYNVNCAVLNEPSRIASRLIHDRWRTRVKTEGWIRYSKPPDLDPARREKSAPKQKKCGLIHVTD